MKCLSYYISLVFVSCLLLYAECLQQTTSRLVKGLEWRIESAYKLVSEEVKCPFFRRRFGDTLEGITSVCNFIIARHKSILPIELLRQPGFSLERGDAIAPKSTGLSQEDLVKIIQGDWRDDGKGYYITGRLSRHIYSEQCSFEGPDPDMPVVGVRKYLAAASRLFEQKTSRAYLLKGPISISEEYEHGGRIEVQRQIRVEWNLSGKLNLPNHPKFKPWSGTTTYFINSEGLIFRHVETWDVSFFDHLVWMLTPEWLRQ